jgi:hypothetical protein
MYGAILFRNICTFSLLFIILKEYTVHDYFMPVYACDCPTKNILAIQ